jgi:hypothetical protein
MGSHFLSVHISDPVHDHLPAFLNFTSPKAASALFAAYGPHKDKRVFVLGMCFHENCVFLRCLASRFLVPTVRAFWLAGGVRLELGPNKHAFGPTEAKDSVISLSLQQSADNAISAALRFQSTRTGGASIGGAQLSDKLSEGRSAPKPGEVMSCGRCNSPASFGAPVLVVNGYCLYWGAGSNPSATKLGAVVDGHAPPLDCRPSDVHVWLQIEAVVAQEYERPEAVRKGTSAKSKWIEGFH